MAEYLHVGRHAGTYFVSRIPETHQRMSTFVEPYLRMVSSEGLPSLLLHTVQIPEDFFTKIVNTLEGTPDAIAWIPLSSEQASRLVDIGL